VPVLSACSGVAPVSSSFPDARTYSVAGGGGVVLPPPPPPPPPPPAANRAHETKREPRGRRISNLEEGRSSTVNSGCGVLEAKEKGSEGSRVKGSKRAREGIAWTLELLDPRTLFQQ